MIRTASHCVFLNVKEYNYDQNSYKTNKLCVCCLSQTIPLINVNTCEHTAFIFTNIKLKVDLQNAHVCKICHNMLKKIEIFRQQIEESIAFIIDNNQIDILRKNKLHNLHTHHLQPIDSKGPIKDLEAKLEVNEELYTDELQLDTNIKTEQDLSDNDADIPLAEISNRKKEKAIDKYEGKIKVVTLTLEELREERENMAKEEKYLKLPYRCELCITGFDHEITWKSHMEKRHKKTKNSLQCNICKSELNNKNSYKEHTKRHLRRLECTDCGKRYIQEVSAMQHYDNNHLPRGSSMQREYTCRECGFTTTVNRTYRYHLDKHKHKQDCKICGKTFVNNNSLKEHMYTVHRQSSRVFRCDTCDKTYRARSGLVAHTRSAHGLAPHAYCTVCRTHYSSMIALKTHLTTHSRHVSESDKRFICDECGAKFIKKITLQNHINWEHLKLNTHRCVKCPKIFKCASSLRRHVNYVHNKERPPRNKICHFCGRGFTTQNILQSHLRTHTGERPLQCKHCRATFAHSGALYTHIKLKHGGVK